MLVLQSYSFRTLLIAKHSIDQTWWARGEENVADYTESQGQVRGRPLLSLSVW